LRNEYANIAWGANKAGLNVAAGAIFDIWDGAATVDYITGAGTINKGWNPNGTLDGWRQQWRADVQRGRLSTTTRDSATAAAPAGI